MVDVAPRGHPAQTGPSLAGPPLGRLVGQALDDIDAARLDVEDALRMVAGIAWKCGHDQTSRA